MPPPLELGKHELLKLPFCSLDQTFGMERVQVNVSVPESSGADTGERVGGKQSG
jgi:hypothetical protein